MTDAQRRVCEFVQAHPRLLAALYDLDLMPVDLLPELVDPRAWSRTVRVAVLYAEAAGLEPPWLVARPAYGRRSPAALARQRAQDVHAASAAFIGAGAVYVPEPGSILGRW